MRANSILVALAGLLLVACGEESGVDDALLGGRDAVSERDCRGGECGGKPSPDDRQRPSHDRATPEKPDRPSPEKPERGDDRSPKPWHPVGDEGWTCEKIEDESIGAEETRLTVGTATLGIDGWVEKDDSPNEWIGFSWTLTGGPVSIRVKAGTEVYEALLEAESGTWLHPNGTEGPNAKAISNIVFCGLEEDEGNHDDIEDPEDPENSDDEDAEDPEDPIEIILE